MHERRGKHARYKLYARSKLEIQGKPEAEEVSKTGGESESVAKENTRQTKHN